MAGRAPSAGSGTGLRSGRSYSDRTEALLLTEAWLHDAVLSLVRLVEASAALVLFAGATVAFLRFVASLAARRDAEELVRHRLDLGRFLALGLELQLASDLLRTAVAPGFDAIGKLAAVATIRTALNFFLAWETRQERGELRSRGEQAGEA